jgi:hypothetical protein
MTTNGNGSTPPAALKMAASIEDSLERGGQGSRNALYFNAQGKRLLPQYERDDGRGGVRPAGPPRRWAFCIEYPFRPSLASLSDMADEHKVTGEPVLYCEERWEIDPRVDEQIAEIAPADPAIDWKLEHLMAELERRDEPTRIAA